jgi:hypothetical protein
MANFGNTNGAIILTIPAGSRWHGQVNISATVTGAPGDANTAAHPSVILSGQGARDYLPGDTVTAVALALPPTSATATVGVSAAAVATSGAIVIQAGANPISLVLNLPPRVTANAVAVGEML